ncbi:Pkinase-domain-containing protein [Suillus ampliporus]|nr:Pkinase-domain-containing protein [Suillus ampliporus]
MFPSVLSSSRIQSQPEAKGTPRPSSLSRTTCKDLYAIVSQVYKAWNVITNVHVVGRARCCNNGFLVTAMREIKLLQSLRHQNVIRLYEMMVSNGSVYMVFEYMDRDLTGANLKSLCSQMLARLAYLHHKGGELKLADFGLARFYQKHRRSNYTNRVITLWYRPPELLFGATVYGLKWTCGVQAASSCIMLELFTKKPVFQGNDEIHQLDRWSGLTALPWYELVKPRIWLSPAALDLAEVTAIEALEAPRYFKEEQPPPELPVDLSTLKGEWHELETKRERAKKRRKLENGLV